MKKIICYFLIIILHLSFVICHLSLASEYLLAPNDQLEVRIVGQKDLDTKQTVAPDGTISLPLLGRVVAQDKTLSSFNKYLSAEFAKYIKNPQVVVYLTPRPIYVIQHDLKKNTWDVKEAKSIPEARAYAGMADENVGTGGMAYENVGTGLVPVREIKYGDIVSVEVSTKPDFWEENWYKVITGVAVVAGIYATLHR